MKKRKKPHTKTNVLEEPHTKTQRPRGKVKDNLHNGTKEEGRREKGGKNGVWHQMRRRKRKSYRLIA